MINASLVLSVLCGVPSCTDEIENEIVENNAKMQEFDASDGTLRLGKRIPNPYSLKVVQQAYNELAEQSGLRSCETLAPTHLYLKFAPKNLEELRLLESDTTLFFYSYPLDVELIGEGGGYHDPSLPDTVPTYQYVCVPIDHPLPEVEYEVLDEVYYEEDEEAGLRSGSVISWEQLEEKAYLIAGDSSIISTSETRGSKQWRAGGRLRYEDNYTNTVVPLEGVPVRMRYHIKTYQNCTDKNGYFQCSTTKRGDCKYSIEWKRAVFRIIPENRIATADYVIQENKSRVDKIFRKSENVKQWIYASLFIPTHEFFYKDMCGIQRPEEDIDITPEEIDSKYRSGRFNGSYPKEIKIFRYYTKDKIEKNSASYYGTTIHELAHSCHREYVGEKTFEKVKSCVTDTWAVGVQDYCSLRKYGEYGRIITYKETDIKIYDSQYTGLVNDLRDNQVEDPLFTQGYVFDDVSGYTLYDIQKALKDATTWEKFKTNVKSIKTINNETSRKIESLFTYWANI